MSTKPTCSLTRGSASVFALMVTLGTLRPTAFSPLTLTSYSVEGVRPLRVVEKMSLDNRSLATTCVSNERFEVGRYSTTYPVMGLPPSFLLAFHWTDMEVEDVPSTDTMVGAEGTNVCVCVCVCVCVIADKSTLISQCDTHGQRTCATPQREVPV